VSSFPTGNDSEKLRVYLYLRPNHHVVLVDNLKRFFVVEKRRICFDCKAVMACRNQIYIHKCQKKEHCKNCNFPFSTTNTILNKDEGILFCDLKITASLSEKICQNCNIKFQSETCFKNHEAACKSFKSRFKCAKCNLRYVPLTKARKEQFETVHTCGKIYKRCTCCFELQVDDYHICKLKNVEIHGTWPNMGFINMKFKDNSVANCKLCYNVKVNFMNEHNLTFKELFVHKSFADLHCDKHKNISVEADANLISLCLENERFKFSNNIFCDDDMKINDVSPTELTYKYCENPKEKSNKVFKEVKSAKSMSRTFYNLLKQNHDLPKKSAINKLMLALCEKSLLNYTFVVENNQICLMILKEFLKLQVIPNVIQRGPQIVVIEIIGLHIKFLSRHSYLSGSLFEIGRQYNIKFDKQFFPDSWNQPKYFNYKGERPPFEDYLTFKDSKEDISDKKTFYHKLPMHWCFKTQIVDVFVHETNIFIDACLKFLTEAFKLQKTLCLLTEKEKNAIHPFGSKIVSLSGFSYTVFRFYYMNNYEMYSVMSPFVNGRTQTSRGEYEYISYLNFTEYPKFIQGAFNCAEGQKNFGKFSVDGYCAETKTVYQYKG
jgi:hypothetical protein